MDKLFLYFAFGFSLAIFCESVEIDVCNAEEFVPDCDDSEIIIIDSAFYGRMNPGHCIDSDHFLGCINSASDDFEELCSGKSSCRVLISKTFHKQVPGACEKYIMGYVKLNYHCLKVAAISSEMCYPESGMSLASSKTLIASEILREKCRNGKLRLSVAAGQRMNVNITEFSGQDNLPLGVIRERAFGNAAYPKTGVKQQHVLTSVGNELELYFQSAASNVAYLYEITVRGCGDMSPPEGAWITRNDDVIEIGCHSGSKSWSLQCVDNQWVGVMGHCGVGHETKKTDVSVVEEDNGTVSLDVIVFGACSLVILASACIFLTGTIILKRKLRPNTKLPANSQITIPIYGYPDDNGDTVSSRLLYADKTMDYQPQMQMAN